jgi:DMSO/TMAO reductase YedYZ molybdopterin-dependent catalytic subunit
LLHIGIKLPDIRYGLQAKLRDGDVLTELPWQENPNAHSNAGTLPAPTATALTRRGLLVTAGLGIGVVLVTSIGDTITPLEPLGALAVRQPSKGPQRVPVNRTAAQANIITAASAADWMLTIDGPRPYTLTLAQIEQLATTEDHLPINCVEGWSVGAQWRGVSLLQLITRAGGNSDSQVHLQSLEQHSQYNASTLKGPQVSRALLATHLNGERLDLDHGYPLRLIAPDRPGVLNTKWLTKIEVS